MSSGTCCGAVLDEPGQRSRVAEYGIEYAAEAWRCLASRFLTLPSPSLRQHYVSVRLVVE